jgi:hypothetical protein
METHVKVLGVIHIVFSAMGLCVALLMSLVFGGAAGIVGASGDPDAQIAIPIIGLTGTVLVGFLLAASLPGLVVGVGLLKLRPWARIGGIVLSIFDLIFVPLGTIVGIYGLWVLFSKDTEPLFTPASPTAPQR